MISVWEMKRCAYIFLLLEHYDVVHYISIDLIMDIIPHWLKDGWLLD